MQAPAAGKSLQCRAAAKNACGRFQAPGRGGKAASGTGKESRKRNLIKRREKNRFSCMGKRFFLFCTGYLPNSSAARRMFSMTGTWNGQRVWQAPQAMQSPACAPSSA